MPENLRSYLEDPFLATLYREIRAAGPLKSISVDITHVCNIRCKGCYYFEEGMDDVVPPKDDSVFDAFIEREKARGTNFVTIVGGEPSLVPDRVKKIYDHFKMNVATNGIKKFPIEGFEEMPIGISVWGDRETDRKLRGGGKRDLFDIALKNYRNDPRAFWYYTVSPHLASEIEPVVSRCIENGNPVLFNYYSDVNGSLNHRHSFGAVQKEIERMIDRYPDRILSTAYFSRVITTGTLFGERWGYDVCTSISPDHPVNRDRIQNGHVYNPHFHAFNADFETTRRCCTGIDRDCDSCYDTWEHFSWVMLNLKKHLGSKKDFTNWLSTMYLFYVINRIVDFEEGLQNLSEIHRRDQAFGSNHRFELRPVTSTHNF